MYSYDSNCDGQRGSSVSHTESAVSKPFGPNGCEVAVNGGKCGETKTLRIIDEFRELYEEKMMQIDTIAGGDCTQAKIKLQQEWINDLTNQNELLVRAVEELEVEATERVRMLEERIKQNATLTYEVMRKYRDYEFPINIDENFQRVAIMQSDIRNLIEFVRRIREDNSWNTNGLQFYQITYEDLFGSSTGSPDNHQIDQQKKERQLNKMNEEVENKNLIIEKLEEQLSEECGKKDDIRKLTDAYQEISALKQSMKDMRDALTAEVADKHDIIVSLRREVVHLEDQCRKADQQTHFKDDIIKELRKEIKQLKHQKLEEENGDLKSRIEELEAENKKLKDAIKLATGHLNTLEKQAEQYLEEKKSLEESHKENQKTIECLKNEKDQNEERYCKERRESQDTIDSLRKKHEETERMSARVSETEEKLSSCNCVIDALKAQVKELQGDKEEAQKTIEKMKAEKEDDNKKLKDCKKKMQDLEKKLGKRESMDGSCISIKSSEKQVTSQEHMDDEEGLQTESQAFERGLKRSSIKRSSQDSEQSKDSLSKRDSKIPKPNKSQDKSKPKPRLSVPQGSSSADLNKKISSLSDYEDADGLKSAESSSKDLSKEGSTLSKDGRSSPKGRRSSSKDEKSSLKEERSLSKEDRSFSRESSREEQSSKSERPSKSSKKKQKSKQKSEESAELEGVIDQLSESVHRMMEGVTGGNKAKPMDEAAFKEKLKEREAEMEWERLNRSREISNLKQTINELEKALKDAQIQGYNLQKAVDIYLESITVLEKSDERSKMELQQQKMTIANLQKALVETKQQLEDLQSSSHHELSKSWAIVNGLHDKLVELEELYLSQLYQSEDLRSIIKNLEDTNLELEVENISHQQDTEMIESKLKKYQQTSLLMERCVCTLKAEILELKSEKAKSLHTINLLQNELHQCTADLLQLQDILQTSMQVDNHNKHLLKELQELKKNCDIFQRQFTAAQKQLGREKQINKINVDRIEELQGIICQKTMENKRISESLCESKRRCEETCKHNRELQVRLEKSQEINELNTAQTNFCHEEINSCLCNLQELKDKMRQETELVNQKVLEYTQLQALYNNQCCDMEILRREIDATTLYYKDEIISLKHQIRDLSEKSTKADSKCKCMQEELKDVQAKLVEATEREAILQQYYSEQEGMLMQKIHTSQNEEIRLLDMNTCLEKQLCDARENLCCKDKQLDATKQALSKLKNEWTQKSCRTQEELSTLKSELTVLMDKYSSLYSENEMLNNEIKHLCKLKCQVKSLTEELNQAYAEIKNLTQDKECLCKKNEDLTREVNTLYSAFNDMNDDYANKTESVMYELVDTKQSRDALCQEGRKVIRNVRSWIMEQQVINKKLKDELQNKKATISKLKRENLSLQSNGKRKQPGGYTVMPYRKPRAPRKISSSPAPVQNRWELGSEGSTSGRDSPQSSMTTSVQLEWYEPEPDAYGQPKAWVHRVESMTQELQKSNRYWQNKLNGYDSMVSRDN